MQQTTTDTSQQWQPPGLGFLKCNVDASFFDAAGAKGVGGGVYGITEAYLL
jgi:hypothetical protein